MSDYPDQLLVERVQRGDKAAFGELVERYQKRIYELAYGFTRNKEDAKDLAQEIFLRAYRGLKRFRAESSFYTWLYSIAQRTCIDHVRKRSRRRPEVEFTDIIAEQMSSAAQKREDRPDAQLVRSEMIQEIYRAVDFLPPQQQRVFVLRYYEGLALREIADTMGIRIGSVKAHLFSATHKLRKHLAPYLDETT